jgi:hypothetical protein
MARLGTGRATWPAVTGGYRPAVRMPSCGACGAPGLRRLVGTPAVPPTSRPSPDRHRARDVGAACPVRGHGGPPPCGAPAPNTRATLAHGACSPRCDPALATCGSDRAGEKSPMANRPSGSAEGGSSRRQIHLPQPAGSEPAGMAASCTRTGAAGLARAIRAAKFACSSRPWRRTRPLRAALGDRGRSARDTGDKNDPMASAIGPRQLWQYPT